MESLQFVFKTNKRIKKSAHVGVVSSGNLEILMEPSDENKTIVEVTTSLDGNQTIWNCILERFFIDYPMIGKMEINDFGANPGIVSMRLLQIKEECGYDD